MRDPKAMPAAMAAGNCADPLGENLGPRNGAFFGPWGHNDEHVYFVDGGVLK